MALDPRYITTVNLEPYFVDKDTGEPLAGGKVFFYEDDSRTTLKDVYQLSGAPPNYSYQVMPNPVILSGNGTIVNDDGDNVALYYFPYVSRATDAAVQLYYVVVKNSNDVEQFTREAWPNLDTGNSDFVTQGSIVNEISNSQFVEVLFDASRTYTISYSGTAISTIPIAPDWDLVFSHTGTGTITIVRNSIAGASLVATQPPYTLTITPGVNLSSIKLVQELSHNPDIWSPIATGVRGYIAGQVLLADASSITMNYEPSNGTAQQIFTGNNTSGDYMSIGGTVQLIQADNSDDSDVGFVNIELVLSVLLPTTLSSIQVVGLETNRTDLAYQQDTVNRQEDHLFHYYNPLLQAKPIKSYLDCWDFPLNPAQFLSKTVAASSTAPGFSKYVWDQTILFQSQQSAIGITQSTTGAIVLTNAAGSATRAALIQYQEGFRAREILNSRLSSMVKAFASANVTATISLWYTTDGALPVLVAGTANSLVQTLDANGKPATFNGTWLEVPRLPINGGTTSTENAQFTIGTPANTNFNEYGFSGWDLDGVAGVGTATFFAMVVGTGDIAPAGTLSIGSISLVPGDIATAPAPQSVSEVLVDAQYWYTKSFNVGTVPAQNINGSYFMFPATIAGAVNQASCTVSFPVRMRPGAIIANVTTYSTGAASSQIYDITISGDCANTAVVDPDETGFYMTFTGNGGTIVGSIMAVNWTCDRRLGIA